MLNALTISREGDERGVVRAEGSLRRQGFIPALRLAWPGGVVQGWTRGTSGGRGSPHEDSVRIDNGCACCVGPIWYRGRFGENALALLLEDLAVATDEAACGIDPLQLRGNFALFLQKGERVWLVNDPLGFQQVYIAADNRFFSTSWLAARAYAEDRGINASAAIEYVLQGASHSDDTVAPHVRKLPLAHAVDLRAGSIRRPAWARPWSSASGGEAAGDGVLPIRFDSIDEAAEWIAEYLGVVFEEIAAAFPGRISAALSGGFDSRLVVAGLLSRGERPRLFVYGGPNSADVSIARQVARGEGLFLDEIDKVAINHQLPALNLEGLVESALFFDGLPNDGIDDPGADRRTRLAQNAEHHIAINGGGGEIFRNFFHLPDRRYRARELVRVFYRGFDATVLRDRAHLAAYEARLARSILSALGMQLPNHGRDDADDPRLSRAQVELAYPLFRCHHWMGVNNSLALRYGYFCTPLVDRQTMSAAAALPLRWKNAGDLEARVIARLNRAAAAHASAYGFSFTEGPHRRARLSETLTCMRPVLARPAINALHRRLRKGCSFPDLLRRYRDLLPGEWRLDPLLQLDRLTDPEALARALAVEVVARELV
jgi:hypothetical protein